jgi:hypothetical protein
LTSTATLITRRAAMAALAVLSMMTTSAMAAARPQNAVVITYRTTAANRPLLRREVRQTLVPRLQAWRRDGTLAGFQLLFSSFVDRGSWDLLAVLTFRDFDGIAKWRKIERAYPGGLDAQELRILTPDAEYLMDTVGRAQAPGGAGRPGVFLVIPYVFSPTPLGRYLQYAHGYILPEAEGWMRRGNISGYGLYVNRFYPDAPTQSLLIIEYKDFAALAHRAAVVEETRQELSADPTWRSWSEQKASAHIRTEKRAVIAEQLAAG